MKARWSGEAVLFDLDGVLVDSMDASKRVWLQARDSLAAPPRSWGRQR